MKEKKLKPIEDKVKNISKNTAELQNRVTQEVIFYLIILQKKKQNFQIYFF